MRLASKIALAAGLPLALGLGAVLPAQPAFAAATPGYTGNAPSSVAGCPYIAWRLVRHPDGAVTGIAYYGDLSGVSEVTGNVDQSGHFQLQTKSSMGNGPVGTVTGMREKNGAIEATMTGQGCANMHLRMAAVANMNDWRNANSYNR